MSESSDIIHPAIETLLTVVEQSANDLRTFHDVVGKARMPKPPFPRTAVAATERIVQNLKDVEKDLRKVMVALGLPV